MSILFLTFSAATLLVYWLIPGKWQGLFLALASSIFLASLDLVSFALLAVYCDCLTSLRKEKMNTF